MSPGHSLPDRWVASEIVSVRQPLGAIFSRSYARPTLLLSCASFLTQVVIVFVGAQVNLSAYSATVYPTPMRSTGLGWIIGVGRVGAIAGALLGTVFVTLGFDLPTQYVLAAVPAVLAGMSVYFARAQHHAAMPLAPLASAQTGSGRSF